MGWPICLPEIQGECTLNSYALLHLPLLAANKNEWVRAVAYIRHAGVHKVISPYRKTSTKPHHFSGSSSHMEQKL